MGFVYAPGFGLIAYVGLLPPGAPAMAYNPAPAGKAAMPERIVRAYQRAMDRLLSGGVEAGDDSAEGYSLSKDPAMRKDELEVMAYQPVAEVRQAECLPHQTVYLVDL